MLRWPGVGGRGVRGAGGVTWGASLLLGAGTLGLVWCSTENLHRFVCVYITVCVCVCVGVGVGVRERVCVCVCVFEREIKCLSKLKCSCTVRNTLYFCTHQPAALRPDYQQ